MKKQGALASALRNSGSMVAASTRVEEPAAMPLPKSSPSLSRQSTKPITVHFPEPVRRQLKTLSAEEGRTMEDLVAEALNLLFASYRKPELAPRKAVK